MDSSKTPQDLIKQCIETEVNKRVSLSIYSKFGGQHCIFKQQYQTTLDSIEKQGDLKRELEIDSQLLNLNRSIKSQRRRLYQLKKIDHKKLAILEDLRDQVLELEEELLADSATQGSQENQHGGKDTGCYCKTNEDTEYDILQWKLETAPRVSGFSSPGKNRP